MAFTTGIGMNPSDDLSLWRGRTDASNPMATLTISCPSEGAIAFTMRPMGIPTVIMTIETANRSAGHDNIVDRGVIFVGIDIGRAGGVMTGGTAKGMQGIDPCAASPGVGVELLECRSSLAMTGITGDAARKIRCLHQHVMGYAVMNGMSSKIAAVTGDAFTACRLPDCTASECAGA